MESKYEILNGMQEMGYEEASIFDHHMKGLKYENGGEKSDSFVVDLESLSNGVVNNEPNNLSTTSSNSRITLQRSLSRKVPQRFPERKIISEIDTLAPSPRAAQVNSTQDQKSLSSPTLMGSQDNSSGNQLPQHQITIKTGSVNTVTDGRLSKRPSTKRSPPSWFANPKRILLFFATLSSMGTLLLIYFTLSMSKRNDKEGGLDWK